MGAVEESPDMQRVKWLVNVKEGLVYVQALKKKKKSRTFSLRIEFPTVLECFTL